MPDAPRPMFELAITDHLEGPRDIPSADIYRQVIELVQLADSLGVQYAWFAEHHAHAHQGHLPTPILLALHVAALTKKIQLGSAVVCLNLHQPLDIAEQIAVADILTNGRIAPGFGSGTTAAECALFAVTELDEPQRHARFEKSLQTIKSIWNSSAANQRPTHLPIPNIDLPSRCWVAVNSAGAAHIAGKMQFNMLFSHLRTTQQYQEYLSAYRAAGGTGKVAANRPLYVDVDDQTAFTRAGTAIRALWHRFKTEGKIPHHTPEPQSIHQLCGHPLNFIVGGPHTVAQQLRRLHQQTPFDVLNLELRWPGLSHDQIKQTLHRFMSDVMRLM